MRIDDMPALPLAEWNDVPADVWHEAEQELGGYQWKCRDACYLMRTPFAPGWMNPTTGLTAAELGAPVGQALFVVLMRRRSAA